MASENSITYISASIGRLFDKRRVGMSPWANTAEIGTFHWLESSAPVKARNRMQITSAYSAIAKPSSSRSLRIVILVT